MSKNKKFTPLIFIPIAVAVFVLIFLAVSGHLTKTEDIKSLLPKLQFQSLMTKRLSLQALIPTARLLFVQLVIILFTTP